MHKAVKFTQIELTESKKRNIYSKHAANYKFLGEVNGASDTALGAADFDTLHSSAINDAKNNAARFIGSDKKATITINIEVATCVYKGVNINCTKRQIGDMKSYRVTAQVFDCKDK